jgi:hypothetical protein
MTASIAAQGWSSMPQVHFEQAVYGSFPFWDKGYATLAASAGCRASWLAEFEEVCQRYGEPGRAIAPAPAMFSTRLPGGLYVVVGVAPQGKDDRGRPGALAFHGLFLERSEFARVDFDPFALAPFLRGDWCPTTELSNVSSRVDLVGPKAPALLSPEANRVVAALSRGQRVAVQSAEPIDLLAREVWHALPSRLRRRRSIATLAYRASNHFDLIALPRVMEDELGARYVTLDSLARDEASESPGLPRRGLALGVVAICALTITAALIVRGGARPRGVPRGIGSRTDPESVTARSRASAFPPRDPFAAPVDADQRERVVEGLTDLASRFGVGIPSGKDPTDLIMRINQQLRYRGAWLSGAELRRLRDNPSPDAVRAVRWHEHLTHFATDRPLPSDFFEGPLDWQLRVLSTSFRVEPHPGFTPAEVPFALEDALAFPGTVRDSPLASRYPALAEYARFLAKLPRR